MNCEHCSDVITLPDEPVMIDGKPYHPECAEDVRAEYAARAARFAEETRRHQKDRNLAGYIIATLALFAAGISLIFTLCAKGCQ